MRTYGAIRYTRDVTINQEPIYKEGLEYGIDGFKQVIVDNGRYVWQIDKAEPHICIRLKHLFPKIAKNSVVPFKLEANDETAADIAWFMERYPMDITEKDWERLTVQKQSFFDYRAETEAILMPEYVPRETILKDGKSGRHYQLVGRDYLRKVKRLLLADDLGLGKTVTGILGMLEDEALPTIVVCETHMQYHWEEKIEEFTNLKTHKIKTRKPYSLPKADVYIMRYSQLEGWIDTFTSGFFKMSIFDEIQNLRIAGSNKYCAAKILSQNATYSLGLSATPIYNMGNEIFAVLNLLNPGCLGLYYDFAREWLEGEKAVKDPKSLGSYLREKGLMLRRTRAEVGMELEQVNKLVVPVEFDEKAWNSVEDLCRMLAIKFDTTTSFVEKGAAGRELSIKMRQATGIAKAKGVANYVRILLENDIPVVLTGWHRDVYDIWLKELAEYKPLMYTGSESPAKKNANKKAFCNGESNLLILSNRSGAGLDGLQHRCCHIVLGELDYSPKVHDQLIGRLDRDGQTERVTAHFPVSNEGSDPPIIDLLGLKTSQSEGIVNPYDDEILEQHMDDSQIKKLVQYILNDKSRKN